MPQADVLDQLATLLMPAIERQKARQFGINMGFKHDSGGSPAAGIYTHGPGGLLTFPGIDQTAFHTVMGGTSLMGQLPTMPSLYTNPTYWTVTGVQDVTGSEKDGVCDDAPVAGLMKGCLTTSVFGRYERATPEIELNRLGQLNDRADPLDITLVGNPIPGGSPFAVGPRNPSAPSDLLTNEISRKMWELNIAIWRQLQVQLWSGSPVNNSAGGGYKEMTGLTSLINTGYVDAETGQACAAMDSYLTNFNSARVDSNGAALVAAITNMYHQLLRRAEQSGIMPVRWVFAMRSQMFYEISAVWPCAYLATGCVTSSATQNIDLQDAIRFRDEMRSGKYLLIDGNRLDVILDDGIPETETAPGVFSSDIYIIPMSVVGGRAVTYMEYFQYNNPSINDALSGNLVLGRVEGPFITWPRQTNLCFELQTKIEPRIVLRTPWLAGRLQNVAYATAQHERSPFPSDPYFVNGGRTTRAGPSYYSVWQSAQ